MGKNFKNINEELNRIKTLMYESDNLILNNYINESVEENVETGMDEDKLKTGGNRAKFKTTDDDPALRGKFKIVKVSDNQFYVKGVGAGQFLTPEGEISKDGDFMIRKMLPQINIDLKPEQMVVRIGDKGRDTKRVDKIYFTIAKKSEAYVKDPIKNEIIPLPPPPPTPPQPPVPPPTPPQPPVPPPTPSGDIKWEIGKTFEDLGVDPSKLINATEKFHSAGWTRGAEYYIDPKTRIVISLDKDKKIDFIFDRKKGDTPIKKDVKVAESFNMDLIFVNPLLFESLLLEQASTFSNSDYYEKNGKKLSQYFTDVVDAIVDGKEIPPKPPKPPKPTPTPPTPTETGPGTEESWKAYPCITQNSVITKSDDPSGNKITYSDKRNTYYSNGRYYDRVSKKMGNYSCDGQKIVATPDKSTGEQKNVLTDKDLLGETGLMWNLIKSMPVLTAVVSYLTPLGFVTSAAVSSVISTVTKRTGVKGVVDALDMPVLGKDLAYVMTTIMALKNKFYYNRSKEEFVPAIERFMFLYSKDEGGDNLISDIQSVAEFKLSTEAAALKEDIVDEINKQLSANVPSDLKVPGSEKSV